MPYELSRLFSWALLYWISKLYQVAKYCEILMYVRDGVEIGWLYPYCGIYVVSSITFKMLGFVRPLLNRSVGAVIEQELPFRQLDTPRARL